MPLFSNQNFRLNIDSLNADLKDNKYVKIIIDFINSSDLEPGCMSSKSGKKGVDPKVKDSLDISLFFSDSCRPSSILGNALHFCVQDYVRRNNELDCIEEWGLFEGYNLQKYNPGQGYYISHCENGGGAGLRRVLAWMIYLNTVPSQNGGGTDFLHQKLTLQPEAGTIVLWPASYTHVHRGGFLTGNVDKYIATGWFIREPT